MNGQVIPFPQRWGHNPDMTYPQLQPTWASRSGSFRPGSRRGCRASVSTTAGRRRFRLSEVIRWLNARQARLGRTMPNVRSPLPREAS